MADNEELAASGGEADPEAEEETVGSYPARDRDLLGRRGSKVRRKLDELRDNVRKGFEDQAERSDAIDDYWDCYNCIINANQFYNGNAEIYVPIVHDAIEARTTRFVNQLFPQSGRYVEAVTSDGSAPSELVALLDHYIRNARLKTQVAKALCRNGDVEGQYNIYVDWAEVERQIVSRETTSPRDPLTGATMPGEEFEDIAEEDIIEGMPVFEVLHDADVLVLPATVDTIEEALSCGGSVTIVRRWSKAKIEQMIEAGAIREEAGEELKETMGKVAQNDHNQEKSLAEHVGIRAKGKEAVVWETWTMLPLVSEEGKSKGLYSDKGRPRLCRVFFGPEDVILGAKRNPYWNDRCPLLSCPAKKIAGVFKGESAVAKVATLQYEANDAVNQGADVANYSALPIVVRDPEQGNGPLILNIAAIWEQKPESVKFMAFPDLTPRAISRVQYCLQAIFQTLGVNPAMLPQQTGRPGAKRNQAEVALEQQVDLLTTAEAVSVLEEGIFTPLMGWCVDLDYQFRDRPLTVRMFGEAGVRAQLEEVAPLQNRNGFEFRWWGVEQARNASQMQQQIAWLNVARGMAQDLQAQGFTLNPAPALEASAQGIFGARLAPLVLVDMRSKLTVDPEIENEMLLDGFEVTVHPLDDDPRHLQAHQMKLRETGDPHGTIRVHMQRHQQSMQLKLAAQMQQQMQQQAAGGGPQQSRAGAPPRMGAQPAGPRLVKGPPGVIHPDQMARAGAPVMPRKM